VEARVVNAGPDLQEVHTLFEEYARWIGVDLSFQGFDQELAGLPGEYVAPRGTLLLCVADGTGAGCVGVRPFRDDTCQMKRLYVRPGFQGRGCGLFLATRAIVWAAGAGYERMVLDTLPSMTAAQRLYERLGFLDVPPYRFNPVPGARFMERRLAPGDGRLTSAP
jgi:GNAT superfamily N-acetyltransferase